ncbi:hypothetical protein CWI38_0583p0060 [Hamiltosporidium tvaerminnensis]|nr:hypothetical protein LUQ84_002108 [Hamiltosporidium tvaerminnensis]TBU12928.1 hypothetical protein CWI38_0583p0060 [Hamiltosporidium tvaerminnensis]
MTWNSIVTEYHKTYVKRLQTPMNIEAYIKSKVLKKTVETISFDDKVELCLSQMPKKASLSVIEEAETHKQPRTPLKRVDNEEDDVKTENTKNITPLILDGRNPVKEPTININEESDLAEDNEMIKIEGRII